MNVGTSLQQNRQKVLETALKSSKRTIVTFSIHPNIIFSTCVRETRHIFRLQSKKKGCNLFACTSEHKVNKTISYIYSWNSKIATAFALGLIPLHAITLTFHWLTTAITNALTMSPTSSQITGFNNCNNMLLLPCHLFLYFGTSSPVSLPGLHV